MVLYKSQSINPINHPICFTRPLRDCFSAWTGHIPFAMYLIDILRPKIFVELGTWSGVSYCAFCQAGKELGLELSSFAVDTWQGDEYTGYYGPEVLEDLRKHHDPRYGSFSQLIQNTFDGAREQFANGTIDLLHIDGYHTYEAVKHDFEGWLVKMSERGVILLHDTFERREPSGAWKLFTEKKEQYPHFEFFHGHGLGLLAVGPHYPEALRELVEAPRESWPAIRELFFQLGMRIEAEQQAQSALAHLQNERDQLQSTLAHIQDERDEIQNTLAHLQNERDQFHNELSNMAAYSRDLSFQLEAAYQVQNELTNELALVQTQLENAHSSAKDLYVQLEAAQKVQSELEYVRGYARNLQSENERLHSELAAASAEVDLLNHSRGVRAIKLARAARYLLSTQGPIAVIKQTLLWLSGKRGTFHQRLAASSAVARPASVTNPAASAPPQPSNQ